MKTYDYAADGRGSLLAACTELCKSKQEKCRGIQSYDPAEMLS